MFPLWLGLLAPGSFLLPIPAGCEPLARALEVLESSAGRAHFGERELGEVMSSECGAAIGAGQWPALTAALTFDDQSGAPRSEQRRQNLRTALCVISPPGAQVEVARWLLERSATGDDAACALMLLRKSPVDFERVAAARFVSTERPAGAMDILAGLVANASPVERLQLLPVLRRATAARETGRDWLYSRLCAEEPARSRDTCRDFPAILAEPAAKRRQFAPLAGHVALALVYASLCVLAQRRWGEESVAWPIVGIGTAAVLVVIGVGVTVRSAGSGALAGALSQIELVAVVPLAIAAGFATAWVLVRLIRLPAASVCVCQALLYIALIVDYGTRNW